MPTPKKRHATARCPRPPVGSQVAANRINCLFVWMMVWGTGSMDGPRSCMRRTLALRKSCVSCLRATTSTCTWLQPYVHGRAGRPQWVSIADPSVYAPPARQGRLSARDREWPPRGLRAAATQGYARAPCTLTHPPTHVVFSLRGAWRCRRRDGICGGLRCRSTAAGGHAAGARVDPSARLSVRLLVQPCPCGRTRQRVRPRRPRAPGAAFRR
jgi:hypothetical protein